MSEMESYDTSTYRHVAPTGIFKEWYLDWFSSEKINKILKTANIKPYNLITLVNSA